jgi:hypothetical protein
MTIDQLDLTGLWHGLYSYPRNRPPVHFVATLNESHSWITGSTEETGTGWDVRGVTITASLQGRQTDRSVTLLKLYDGPPRGYDTVHYAGTVSADGNEIEGQWTVPGSWAGSFLMIRSGGASERALREELIKAR